MNDLNQYAEHLATFNFWFFWFVMALSAFTIREWFFGYDGDKK